MMSGVHPRAKIQRWVIVPGVLLLLGIVPAILPGQTDSTSTPVHTGLGAVLGGAAGFLAGALAGGYLTGQVAGAVVGAFPGEVVGIAAGGHLGNGRRGHFMATLGTSAGVGLAGAALTGLTQADGLVSAILVATVTTQVIGVMLMEERTSDVPNVRPYLEPGSRRWGVRMSVDW